MARRVTVIYWTIVLGRSWCPRNPVQDRFRLEKRIMGQELAVWRFIMKRSLCAAALLAGLGLAAATIPAAAQRVGEANCIAPINFDSWRALDDKTVILTSRTRRDYKVSLAPGCFDLDFAMRIGIKSFSTSRLQ